MSRQWKQVALCCSVIAMLGSACGSTVPAPPNAAARRTNRTIVDMRGVSVTIPATITRVATIDDGFIEGVMTHLGTIRTLVAVGSSSQQRVWSYTYPIQSGQSFTMADGMGTMRVLHPWLADLPCASRTSGDAINYETLAAAKPDVVIARMGDCTVGSAPDTITKLAGVFQSLGIPLVLLRSPTDYRGDGLESLRTEIEVIGRVFGREKEAAALAADLAATETMIRSRVSDVPEAARPRVLYLGLAAGARQSGGAAYVWGTATAESWMIEQVVGGRNAYRGPGARVLLNAEQILALDPDVIFLPTAAGYHPPEELAQAPYFATLQRLRAVRTGRVYALPWSPMNCARRLEYPLDLLITAKGAYPERFRDILVARWALDFYMRTYHIDTPRAEALRRAQWLDWTVTAGF